jgi:hypothetical protein
MKSLVAGLVAGFVATVVLSALMVAKTMMGVMRWAGPRIS